MSYASIILLLLKIVSSLSNYFQQQKWMNEGEALAVAKAAAEMVRKSKYAKQVMDEVNAMPDAAVDDSLRELEPGNDKR